MVEPTKCAMVEPTTVTLSAGFPVVVDVLKNRPELAATCAQLCFTAFQAAYIELGFLTVQSALDDLRKSCMNDDRMPIVLVCCDASDVDQGRLLGTVTLEDGTCHPRPDPRRN